MYTTTNFKAKKALREAVKAGEKVTIYQQGPFGGNEPKSGTVYLEGPRFPEPHRWYAQARVEDGYIVEVK